MIKAVKIDAIQIYFKGLGDHCPMILTNGLTDGDSDLTYTVDNDDSLMVIRKGSRDVIINTGEVRALVVDKLEKSK